MVIGCLFVFDFVYTLQRILLYSVYNSLSIHKLNGVAECRSIDWINVLDGCLSALVLCGIHDTISAATVQCSVRCNNGPTWVVPTRKPVQRCGVRVYFSTVQQQVMTRAVENSS